MESNRTDFVAGEQRTPYDSALATDPDIAVCRISGAFFFGAASAVGAALDRIAERPKAFVSDMEKVQTLDASGAATIAGLVRKAGKAHQQIVISGAAPQIRRMLKHHNVGPPSTTYAANVPAAMARLRQSRIDPAPPVQQTVIA